MVVMKTKLNMMLDLTMIITDYPQVVDADGVNTSSKGCKDPGRATTAGPIVESRQTWSGNSLTASSHIHTSAMNLLLQDLWALGVPLRT